MVSITENAPPEHQAKAAKLAAATKALVITM
jgi:hypothetical protein